MKFRVTGGADGVSGIDVGNRRYEAGDVVEMTSNKAEWLVERGLLVADSKWSAEPEVEDEPELDEADDETDDESVDDDETSLQDNIEGDDL
jgi:hypothetical protein